ncbi:hypothetical protein DJ70_02520 [Halorubrum halodurans]|uniref:Uncharacterized protein n=1 Tax=Halorubrum halodurans TaxID=1383851 RepID=A0A256IPW2_9EURY|nr:hypothetical protein DJ70_02520 [Halorubrum halodurans]
MGVSWGECHLHTALLSGEKVVGRTHKQFRCLFLVAVIDEIGERLAVFSLRITVGCDVNRPHRERITRIPVLLLRGSIEEQLADLFVPVGPDTVLLTDELEVIQGRLWLRLVLDLVRVVPRDPEQVTGETVDEVDDVLRAVLLDLGGRFPLRGLDVELFESTFEFAL